MQKAYVFQRVQSGYWGATPLDKKAVVKAASESEARAKIRQRKDFLKYLAAIPMGATAMNLQDLHQLTRPLGPPNETTVFSLERHRSSALFDPVSAGSGRTGSPGDQEWRPVSRPDHRPRRSEQQTGRRQRRCLL